MKVTQRQPICVTRLRKKSSKSSVSGTNKQNSKGTDSGKESRMQLSNISDSKYHTKNNKSSSSVLQPTKYSSFNTTEKDASNSLYSTHKNTNSQANESYNIKKSCLYSENQLHENDQTQTTIYHNQLDINLMGQLQDKIIGLEQQNSVLKQNNLSMKNKLKYQELQKKDLSQRIYKLEECMDQFVNKLKTSQQLEQKERQRLQQQNIKKQKQKTEKTISQRKKRNSICKMVQLQSFTYSKPKTINLCQSTELQKSKKQYSTSNLNCYRHRSFHDTKQTHYLQQDPSIKLKQYKNQLELEKLRRINLERQIKNCKQNTRHQFRSEIESLQRKISHLKDSMSRKDKQIFEKENIIKRYLVKK